MGSPLCSPKLWQSSSDSAWQTLLSINNSVYLKTLTRMEQRLFLLGFKFSVVTQHTMGQYLEVLLATDISVHCSPLTSQQRLLPCWSRLAEGEGVWVLSALGHCEAASEAARGWILEAGLRLEAEAEAQEHTPAPGGSLGNPEGKEKIVLSLLSSVITACEQ